MKEPFQLGPADLVGTRDSDSDSDSNSDSDSDSDSDRLAYEIRLVAGRVQRWATVES